MRYGQLLRNLSTLFMGGSLTALVGWSGAMAQNGLLELGSMPRIGTVSERYQSYNVEMLEVTGGRFWKPYKDIGKPPSSQSEASTGDTPASMSADLYQYRPPVDLSNKRLRTLARALGPAYVRLSGTWANTTYFADSDSPPKDPPKGYAGVLTRQQWTGAIDFSRAVDAEIVTSAPISAGTRGTDQVWQPDQTRTWLAFTLKHGGKVAAMEYFNEPTLAAMGGAPKGYDAAAFGRDFGIFEAFMRKEFPATKILAPGSVGEADAGWGVAMGGYGDQAMLKAYDLAAHSSNADAFSYHHYGAVSQRCSAMGHQTTPEEALSEDWLGRTDRTLAYYRAVRDKAMAGKRFWNTETADAACGGNPWGGTFLDTFRYLDQLGRLARQEVDVVFHNTLIASDYGLLDENTFAPKPNYWGALLWRRLMGTTVLDVGVPIREGLHLYAHCLRGTPGGVAVLAINNSVSQPASFTLPTEAVRYTLTSERPQAANVLLNGRELRMDGDDRLPDLAGQAIPSGSVELAPGSINFFAAAQVGNANCR